MNRLTICSLLMRNLRTFSQSSARRIVTEDIMITRTGKTILRIGTGGRSSKCNHIATVFGATGFLGRYIVHKLAKQGVTVVVPWRDEMQRRHLKVTGDLGQVVMLEFEPRNISSIESAVKHSTMVYNLIGRDFETKNFSFQDTHVTIAGRIAEACAKFNVDRFVHVSALGADVSSPSKFFETKAQGEALVREILPHTTIVRPATVFGHEDRFLHTLANNPAIAFELNHGNTLRLPISAIDFASALENMIWDDDTTGKTYELYSDHVFKIFQVREMIQRAIFRSPKIIQVPYGVAKIFAYILDKLYWNITSPDQLRRQYIDECPSKEANVLSFKDLGIYPILLDDIQCLRYLRMYRNKVIMDKEAEHRKDFAGEHLVD